MNVAMNHICVPVLKRYDLLRELILSLKESTVPVFMHVIDNGHDRVRLAQALNEITTPVDVLVPTKSMGVAESWNWFINNVAEERFIVNDDIVFAPESIEKMVASPAPFVSCGFGFSCFLLRDACVATVGLFDETISPGYAYFEDRDYYNRMKQAKIVDEVVTCGVVHKQSQTLVGYSPLEMQMHHHKYVKAQENFLKKWGTLPADVARQTA